MRDSISIEAQCRAFDPSTLFTHPSREVVFPAERVQFHLMITFSKFSSKVRKLLAAEQDNVVLETKQAEVWSNCQIGNSTKHDRSKKKIPSVEGLTQTEPRSPKGREVDMIKIRRKVSCQASTMDTFGNPQRSICT